MIFPLALFFVALVLMLYARLFSDKTSPLKNQAAQTSVLESTSTRGPLPPAVNEHTCGWPQQVRTNELVQRPSVTEHTTRLLDNE